MADEEQLAVLRQGADAWNRWRREHKDVWLDLEGIDLVGANLEGANLLEAHLNGAHLEGANLSRATLYRATLDGANLVGAHLNGARLVGTHLEGANLHRATLGGAHLQLAHLDRANLVWADLVWANLEGANLSRADLTGADLAGANLVGASLNRTDLTEADLAYANLAYANLAGANLVRARFADVNSADVNSAYANLPRILFGASLANADLRGANLIDARLDGADLTGAKLWGTQRDGWSIEGITCHRASWDRHAEEWIEYPAGAFERAFAEGSRIVLRYPGGISPVDLAMLPLVIERLQAEHPGCALTIRSVQDDGDGASVAIAVEDLEGRDAEAFVAEVEALRGTLVATQERLQSEERLRVAFETRYQAVLQDVLPMFLERALPKQEIHVGQLTAPMIIEGTTMSRDTYNVHGQAGAVGPGARANRNTFLQVQGSGIDLAKLAEELGRLRDAMKGETTGTREQDKAIVAVADAEAAAAKGDGTAALRYLKSAGTWTLEVAKEIGVPVAIEALKRAM